MPDSGIERRSCLGGLLFAHGSCLAHLGNDLTGRFEDTDALLLGERLAGELYRVAGLQELVDLTGSYKRS